ncbi:MAG: BamA/TamA family outer membrane protein [Candidatus Coatesbacteria bacterium]|nr:MAG: BamA/TamA family outer membrane protein [Candidatus Coatesbacteria bacterium]
MREAIIILLIPTVALSGSLTVVGNESVPIGEVLTAAGSEAEPDVAAVERLYDLYGHLDAEVRLSADGGTLMIEEGPVYSLTAVSIAGEIPYAAKEVEKRLNVDRGDPLSVRTLERGLTAILESLRDDGYLEAGVDYEVNKNPGTGTADVTLDFRVGQLYTVGEIRFLGVGAFIEDELRHRMDTREGTRFSEAWLGADIISILDLYRENGYPNATAVPGNFVLARAFKAVDFTVYVDEGPKVVVGDIIISGNERTRDNVVRREFTLKPGEPYDVSDVRKSARRIYLLKYFAEPPDINVVDPANGVLEVNVKERRTYAISGALGYEPATEYASANLLGYVSASIHNLLGTGRDIDVGFSRPGENNLDADAAYREPWIGGVDLFARPEVEYRERATYRRVEGELTLGTRPLEGLTVAAGAGFGRVWETDPSRTVKAIGRAEYDTRDYFPNPRTGWEISIDAEGRFKEYYDDGFRDFVPAVELDGWRYFPITRNMTLAARGKAAGVFATRFTDDEYFYLGGPRDLRGFRNEQFPVSHYALGTLEYRFLVGRDGRLFVFADGAYRRRRSADGTDSGFELGYGAGFRAPTALGTYGVDFAVAAGDSPLDGKIHVTVTQEF